MNPNPITVRDKLIAELQIRYRTFYVEFDINEISYNFVHIIRRVVSPKKSYMLFSYMFCFIFLTGCSKATEDVFSRFWA
jgi:hypothetical protein